MPLNDFIDLPGRNKKVETPNDVSQFMEVPKDLSNATKPTESPTAPQQSDNVGTVDLSYKPKTRYLEQGQPAGVDLLQAEMSTLFPQQEETPTTHMTPVPSMHSIISDVGGSSAKNANINAIADAYNLSPSFVSDHYDEIVPKLFTGAMPSPAKTLAQGLMGAGVTYGVFTNPLTTAYALGKFFGLDELENAAVSLWSHKPYEFQGGKGLPDLLHAHGLSRDALDILDFMWKGAAIGASEKVGRGLLSSAVRKIKGEDAKVNLINKVANKVKETGESPDEVVANNANELGINVDTLREAHDKIVKGEDIQKLSEQDTENTAKLDIVIKGKQISAIKEEPGIEEVRQGRLNYAEEKAKSLDQETKTIEVDHQTGVKESEQLNTEQSPFREKDQEIAGKKKEMLSGKDVSSSPALMLFKLINDVNLWLNGDDSVNIEDVRNSLSKLAVSANDFNNRYNLLRYFNNDSSAAQNFVKTADEAAKWARRADRSKIEQTGKSPGGVQLNMMIPVDQVPKKVSDFISKVIPKAKDVIKLGMLYRNKDLWEKTGFWLGKDGKWRYELDDSNIKLMPESEWTTEDRFGVRTKPNTLLSDIIDYPELFEAVPGLSDTKVAIGPHISLGSASGRYNTGSDTIDLRLGSYKKTILHEIQHAINHKLEAFKGSSPEAFKGPGIRDAFTRYMNVPGEMEARLTEARSKMSPEERKRIPPWETLDSMLHKEGLTPYGGIKLYDIGGASAEAIKQILRKDKRIHPAAFPKDIQKSIANILIKLGVQDVLDIFGGIGKIGLIKDYGYKGTVRANEIEPRWGGVDTKEIHKTNKVDVSIIGDARHLDLPDNSVEAVATSPTYGNAMALKSPKKKDSYTAFAGGKLHEANTGGEVWGPRYEQLHKEAYKEAYRVVKPGGYFILNMKDKPVTAKNPRNRWIPKKNSTVEVKNGVMKSTDWHIKALEDAGFELIERIKIKEAPKTTNIQRLAKTVGYEELVVLGKPKKVGGIKLYDIGSASAESAKQIIEGIRKGSKLAGDFVRNFRKSRELKKTTRWNTFKQMMTDADKAFLDQTEGFLKKFRYAYPRDYERIATRYRSAVTGKGYGSVMFEQANKEIYSGLSDAQLELLDLYIHGKRFEDIYGYVPKYKHEKGYGPTETYNLVSIIEMLKDTPEDLWKTIVADKDLMNVVKNMSREEVDQVIRGANSYFEYIRDMVDFLVETGVKSKEEGELLKAHNYKKFRSLYIDKLYDFDYDLRLRGSTIKSTNSGVVDLGQGSIKILDTDSKAVLIESLTRGYGSGTNNVAKLAWKDFALKYPDNGFVHPGSDAPIKWKKLGGKEFGDKNVYYDPAIKSSDEFIKSGAKTVSEFYKSNPESPYFTKGTGLKTPEHWVGVPYLDKGVKKIIYFHPDVADYLITGSRDISHRMTKLLSMGFFAPLTRTLAVGASPIWATLRGLPMDVGHTLWTARTWEGDAKGIRLKLKFPFFEITQGKFVRVYNPYVPLVDKLELGHDMEAVYRDVVNKGPLTRELMRHGLMMNFLTQREGKYMKGIKPPGDWAKMMDLASSWGLKMELWPRVATARRVILREAKKRGITFEQALKNDDIMYKAAHAARDRMDYNQGGWFIRALDHCGLIFLNAAVLGTRTFWRDAADDPVAFFIRVARIGATASGLTYAMWSLYPDEAKNMGPEPREVRWPIAPKYLRTYDEDGNLITFHAKLNMDPNIAFFYRFFEGLTMKYMHDSGMIKTEPDYKGLVESLKHLGPVDIGLPPLVQGLTDYATNYSWWRSDQIYKDLGGKTLKWPKSRFEGAESKNVPQIAKDIAGVTGLSPKRLAGAGSDVIPYNNEFVQVMNMVYEGVRGDIPEEVKTENWLLMLAELPGFNRVIGLTRHDSGRWRVKREISDEEELKRLVRNAKFDRLAIDYAWYGDRKRKEVIKYIRSFKDRDIYHGFIKSLKFIENPVVKNLPHRKFWLSFSHMSLEGKARTWNRIYKEAGEKERGELWKEYRSLSRAKLISPEFKKEVMKLRYEESVK